MLAGVGGHGGGGGVGTMSVSRVGENSRQGRNESPLAIRGRRGGEGGKGVVEFPTQWGGVQELNYWRKCAKEYLTLSFQKSPLTGGMGLLHQRA